MICTTHEKNALTLKSLLRFDKFQVLFERRLLLPIALYAFLPLFLRIRQDFLGPFPFDGAIFPHSL